MRRGASLLNFLNELLEPLHLAEHLLKPISESVHLAGESVHLAGLFRAAPELQHHR